MSESETTDIDIGLPSPQLLRSLVNPMEVLLRGASFELGGMKHRSPTYWGLIGGFGF